MKKCLKSWYKILVAVEEYDKVDWCALGLGALVLVCSFVLPTNFAILNIFKKLLIIVAAIWGLIYISRIAYLWFRKRPIFDWLLVNGHFLRKVCCLVVLVPAVLTVGTSLIVKTSSELHTDFEQLHSNYNSLSSESVVNEGDYPDLLWLTYFHFIDPGNQDMALYHIDRVWVAIVSILGMLLLNGLLVSSLIGWFDRRREKWLKGETPYNKFLSTTDHYVIIGGSDVVAGIVNQLMVEMVKKGKKEYIVIQTSRDVENFRRELFSTLKKEEAQRIIVRYGNRTSEKDIAELHIERAIEVYIIGEDTRTDDIESFHDTMNMECLDLVSKEAAKVEKFKDNNQLTCRVMFEYQTTFSVFQFSDISDKISKYINFKPFNYYEIWAQKVLINTELDEKKLLENFTNGGYLPLEGSAGIRGNSKDYVHLIIVGMSRMGVAMAIEAAHLAHYPNYETNKIRTKITFIDKNAVEEKEFFMGRFKELFELSHWRYGSVDNGKLNWSKSHSPLLYKYKHLGGDFLDIEWEFINGGIELSAVQSYILHSANKNARVTIAICLPESNKPHASGLFLDKTLYELKSIKQVLVYNRYGNAVIKSLETREARVPYQNKLRAFGESKDCLDLRFIEQVEKLGTDIGNKYTQIENEYINKAVKEACQDDIEKREKETKGYGGKSKAAKFWSNIYNANTMWAKLRSMNFNGEEYANSDDCNRGVVEILADVEHNRWNIEQLLMNFRPLTPTQQAEVLDGTKTKNECKQNMCHLNICSNKCLVGKLSEIDVVARAYDIGLTSLLPELYKNWKTND